LVDIFYPHNLGDFERKGVFQQPLPITLIDPVNEPLSMILKFRGSLIGSGRQGTRQTLLIPTGSGPRGSRIPKRQERRGDRQCPALRYHVRRTGLPTFLALRWAYLDFVTSIAEDGEFWAIVIPLLVCGCILFAVGMAVYEVVLDAHATTTATLDSLSINPDKWIPR
jgi:hypothetical protein